MSKAVPFLPTSPALEGLAGEEDGFDPVGFTLALRVPGITCSTIEAHNAALETGALQQMFVWIGYAEFWGLLAFNKGCEGFVDRKPGDFGLRLLYPTDPKGQ